MLQLQEPQANQLHMGFLWYSSKRSTLIGEMQQTMQQVQQLLGAVHQRDTQQQEQQQQQQQQQQTPLDSAAASGSTIPVQCSGSGSGSGTSSGSSTGLNLDMLEDADNILQDLGRLVWRLHEVSRCLIYRYCNVLDPYQLSMPILHSFPYIGQPPPIIEAVVKKRVAAQQKQEAEQEQQQQQEEQQRQQQRRRRRWGPRFCEQQQQQKAEEDEEQEEEEEEDVTDSHAEVKKGTAGVDKGSTDS
jgi:hypothetical protein